MTASLATPGSNTGEAAGDTYYSIENLLGGAYADTLIGDGNANSINGGAGDDILIGGAGADTLSGASGTDTATAATGVTANLTTSAGKTGDAAGDTYTSIESLTGSAFADTLTGDGNANTLEGGTGNDILFGSTGNDTFVFHAGFGADTIGDFDSGTTFTDVIQIDFSLFANFAAIQAHAAQVGSDTVITMMPPTQSRWLM